MVPGKVYRRQDLEGVTSAVDRDLKTLVERGIVEKIHSGLYHVPRRNPYGMSPPQTEEIVRAFLKTDDFLINSYNHYNQLRLGLTQMHANYVVYNHKRTGDFEMGGRRLSFHMMPAYPRRLSKEYLLVDMLNNLAKLPDDTERVRKSLSTRLNEFNRDSVMENLAKYGKASTRKMLEAAYAQVRA